MKYILTFMIFMTMGFAQGTYGYGNIDMHGGKTDSLSGTKDKNMNNFGNKDMGMSGFLNKKDNKKNDKKENKSQIDKKGYK